MDFVRIWLLGFYSPRRCIEKLAGKPAPQWGFFAQLLRAALVSLLLYLPLGLMGREPPTPSYLRFVATSHYYLALVWIAPIVLGR